MARVLDLGCGTGNPPVRANLSQNDEIIGVDINQTSLAAARQRFPQRKFYCSCGESLPFADASFDRVVSSVALPYMDIPTTLSEVARVLVPGGGAFFSVHPSRFLLGELAACATKPAAMAYRLCVLLNGLFFHATGKSLKLAGKAESFQTERGLKIGLRQAGFEDVVFSRPAGRLIVEARLALPATMRVNVATRFPPEATRLPVTVASQSSLTSSLSGD